MGSLFCLSEHNVGDLAVVGYHIGCLFMPVYARVCGHVQDDAPRYERIQA